jgi:hypothetical protein
VPYRDPSENRPYPLPIFPARPLGDGHAKPPAEYEWVDRKAGIVRIPIEDAMTVAAGRLPARKGEGPPDRPTRKAPAIDAGSGRNPK